MTSEIVRPWMYRRQAGEGGERPMKAHLWQGAELTLCELRGKRPLWGNYSVPEEDRCKTCLKVIKMRGMAWR